METNIQVELMIKLFIFIFYKLG